MTGYRGIVFDTDHALLALHLRFKGFFSIRLAVFQASGGAESWTLDPDPLSHFFAARPPRLGL